MRRLVGLVVDNWPLKVAAVVLATLLYGGFAVSENAQVWRGRVAVTPLRQPATAVLLGAIPDVTQIRYFAPADVAARMSSDSFSATIDLADAAVDAASPFVSARVVVTAADPRIRILDYEPQVIRIQLDPLVSRTVPVQVERGPLPSGLTVRDPEVDPATATVRGPESVVRLVAAVQARVLIQPSGLDVDQQVDLVAVDLGGNVLTPVDIEPGTAHVRIRVGSQLGTRTLPVRPRLSGAPAAGWEVESIAVEPAVVLVEGEQGVIAPLASVVTAPVVVTDASEDVTSTVELVLPDGVTAVGTQTVRVVVKLREVTGTRSVRVAIQASGGRSGFDYAVSPPTATIVLGGPVARLDRLDAATLVATVDVSGMGVGTSRLAVRFAAPAGLTLVSLTPASADVTATAAP